MMNENLHALLDGGFIERYHTKGQRMLTRQSVSDHSWRMAAIVRHVWPDCRVELVWAVLFHDVSERVTGDMPSPIKTANPAVQAALNKLSTDEEVRLGIRFTLDDEERRMLAWVDRFEGAVHCADELEMGNRKVIGTLRRYLDMSSQTRFRLLNHNRALVQLELVRTLTEKVDSLIGDTL